MTDEQGDNMQQRMLRMVVPLLAGVIALGTASVAGATTRAHSVAHASKTYTIAYEGPLSGGNAQLGLNMEYAVELAVQQANQGKSFGKLNFKLAFTATDDQGSATDSPAAAASLINNSAVVAVVGPAFSGATKAAEPALSAANLATVSPSATAPILATQGWNNFFRVVADDNAQGPADAQYAVKVLKVKSVYSIDDASAYAVGLVDAFDTAAKSKYGASVTHDEVPGTTQCSAGTGNVQEYGAEATKVVSSHAKVVFYAGYYCDFALLAKALRSAGYNGKLMSDDGSLDPHYVASAGTAVANGTFISCACAALKKNATTSAFISGFKKIAKFSVGTYSAEAYDATNAIISVMSKASKITRSNIVKGLHKVNYSGLTKTVQFASNGDIKGSSVYVYEVKRGQIVQLGLVGTLK
jgi:branched-chain amino acid transport system substrate-binding protein